MFRRIVNRQRPVVVLLAIYKVARERQSVRESEVKLDLFATQIRRGRQGRDLGKGARVNCSAASTSAELSSDRRPALPHHSMAPSLRPACVK